MHCVLNLYCCSWRPTVTHRLLLSDCRRRGVVSQVVLYYIGLRESAIGPTEDCQAV